MNGRKDCKGARVDACCRSGPGCGVGVVIIEAEEVSRDEPAKFAIINGPGWHMQLEELPHHPRTPATRIHVVSSIEFEAINIDTMENPLTPSFAPFFGMVSGCSMRITDMS